MNPNQFIKKVEKKIYYWIYNLYYWQEIKKVRNDLSNNSKNIIYLFGVPTHPNIGDQAQTYCIINILKQHYPDYEIKQLTRRTLDNEMLKQIRKIIKPNDLIFLHSGYFFFDPHPDLPIYREICNLFHDKRIVIFPQTINLKSEKIISETQNAFNNHPNLILFARDEISFNNAKKIFTNCSLYLYPDIVTSLIGQKSYNFTRKGILFCMRNDLEMFYSKSEIKNLMKKLKCYHVSITDTTIQTMPGVWKKHREDIINKTIQRFAHYKLIITDRYHGTIFSIIASTPVIVLNSADHKLSSGVKWFPESFSKRIIFANSLEQAYELAIEIMKNPPLATPEPYFKEKYYNSIFNLIESKNKNV